MGQILRFAEDDSGGGGPSQGRSFAALRMTREGGVFVGQIFRFAQDDTSFFRMASLSLGAASFGSGRHFFLRGDISLSVSS